MLNRLELLAMMIYLFGQKMFFVLERKSMDAAISFAVTSLSINGIVVSDVVVAVRLSGTAGNFGTSPDRQMVFSLRSAIYHLYKNRRIHLFPIHPIRF